MALSIKHPEADRLARELASTTGESLTQAVLVALRERLERESGWTEVPGIREEIARIQHRVSRMPLLDYRSDDEILGYLTAGLPGCWVNDRPLEHNMAPTRRCVVEHVAGCRR